jgi:nucleotide-binding universal stress UspA family protein
VHAWDEPVAVAVELDPTDLPELQGPAMSQALPGSVASVLLAQQADLLVLGGRASARHPTHLMRSLLHSTRCPVVVLHETDAPAGERVVVGVGGTEASRLALRWAADEAWLRQLPLTVVHAWQVHPTSTTDVLHPARAVPSQGRHAQTRLAGWVQAVLGQRPVELVLSHGPRLEALLEVSEGADLVVLGRSPHSSLDRVVHGAVGDDVSALAGCPVVIVPHCSPTP